MIIIRFSEGFFQLEEPYTNCTAAATKGSFKTKMCPFLLCGKCFKGSQCSFAHTEEELRLIPDLNKTKLCTRYQMGNCNKGESCTFAHGMEELVEPPNFFKTSLCIPYMNGKACRFGTKCKFAHGTCELREKPSPKGIQHTTTEYNLESYTQEKTKIYEAPIKSCLQFESLPEKLSKQCNASLITSSSSQHLSSSIMFFNQAQELAKVNEFKQYNGFFNEGPISSFSQSSINIQNKGMFSNYSFLDLDLK